MPSLKKNMRFEICQQKDAFALQSLARAGIDAQIMRI